MKLPVWSGTPSGTVWSSPDSAEGFSQPFLRVKRAGCLRPAVSVPAPVLLSGGLCRFGGRDRRAAPATRLPS